MKDLQKERSNKNIEEFLRQDNFLDEDLEEERCNKIIQSLELCEAVTECLNFLDIDLTKETLSFEFSKKLTI